MLLSNQKCMIQPTLFNLHRNEYSQYLQYYPFAVKLDRCVRSCNTLNNLSNKVFVPNKTEDLNLSVFNLIMGINESKILRKHISCECECKFDCRKCNSNHRCECKKHICEKDYIWNTPTCSSENDKYLASIADDLVITCDEILQYW